VRKWARASHTGGAPPWAKGRSSLCPVIRETWQGPSFGTGTVAAGRRDRRAASPSTDVPGAGGRPRRFQNEPPPTRCAVVTASARPHIHHEASARARGARADVGDRGAPRSAEDPMRSAQPLLRQPSGHGQGTVSEEASDFAASPMPSSCGRDRACTEWRYSFRRGERRHPPAPRRSQRGHRPRRTARSRRTEGGSRASAV